MLVRFRLGAPRPLFIASHKVTFSLQNQIVTTANLSHRDTSRNIASRRFWGRFLEITPVAPADLTPVTPTHGPHPFRPPKRETYGQALQARRWRRPLSHRAAERQQAMATALLLSRQGALALDRRVSDRLSGGGSRRAGAGQAAHRRWHRSVRPKEARPNRRPDGLQEYLRPHRRPNTSNGSKPMADHPRRSKRTVGFWKNSPGRSLRALSPRSPPPRCSTC